MVGPPAEPGRFVWGVSMMGRSWIHIHEATTRVLNRIVAYFGILRTSPNMRLGAQAIPGKVGGAVVEVGAPFWL